MGLPGIDGTGSVPDRPEPPPPPPSPAMPPPSTPLPGPHSGTAVRWASRLPAKTSARRGHSLRGAETETDPLISSACCSYLRTRLASQASRRKELLRSTHVVNEVYAGVAAWPCAGWFAKGLVTGCRPGGIGGARNRADAVCRTGQARFPGEARPGVVAVGDVDGDGDRDVAVARGGQVDLYLNDGSGTLTDATATRMPAGPTQANALVFGDLDGDGDLDLIVGTYATNGTAMQTKLYLNNSAGVFGDVTSTRMPPNNLPTTSLALGDIDCDGDLDLVVGNWRPETRIYTNLVRQLDAPRLLRTGRPYRLDAYARFGPPSPLDVAWPAFSTQRVQLPMPLLGMLGIDPNQMVRLPPIVIAQPAGIGSLLIQVPNVPALAGITFYTQALLEHPGVALHLTNVVGDPLLR